jgi:hypothetical protein
MVFRIVKIEIVDSPAKYLKEGVLHTEKAKARIRTGV